MKIVFALVLVAAILALAQASHGGGSSSSSSGSGSGWRGRHGNSRPGDCTQALFCDYFFFVGWEKLSFVLLCGTFMARGSSYICS